MRLPGLRVAFAWCYFQYNGGYRAHQRIMSTTSSRRMPTTSIIGFCPSWPTAIILSLGEEFRIEWPAGTTWH